MSLATIATADSADDTTPAAQPPRLAIVVPCHNEVESLARLDAELSRLQGALAGQYELELLFVDDGSTDATAELLHSLFAGRPDVQLVKHEQNRGIAAAIATGMARARTEAVASLDADCTYTPLQLTRLLERFTDGVDMVVASPYHPEGQVVGVPQWRLALSRLASRCYRLVMRNKLHTYTSCVRVYRQNSVANLPLRHPGFVGIVELVWQLDRRGGTIVECPAVLTVRAAGQSKMRLARTTLAHLRFLAQAAWYRFLSPNRGRITPHESVGGRTRQMAPHTT